MSVSLAIVIPAFCERETLPITLSSLQSSFPSSMDKSRVNVIVVINNPTESLLEFEEENLNTMDDLKKASFSFNLTPIFAPNLEHGVGEARKIGMDYAVKHFLHSPQDLLLSLDADSSVSRNYVEVLSQKKLEGAGFTLSYQHDVSSTEQGIILYELYLRYLQFGLHISYSHFDFMAIGSALGTNAKFYEHSGGMPCKDATEDFHFLNKLRKFGSIEHWPEVCVYPSARRSTRVYLGTGHFLNEFHQHNEKALHGLSIPSPKAFSKLAKLNQTAQGFYSEESFNLTAESKEEESFLTQIYIRIQKLSTQVRSEAQYLKRLPQVFDGLQNLRYLKVAEEQKPVDIAQFLEWAQKLKRETTKDPLELLKHYR